MVDNFRIEFTRGNPTLEHFVKPLPLAQLQQVVALIAGDYGVRHIESLKAAATQTVPLLQLILVEARMVLGGDATAADRLWHLLRGAAEMAFEPLPDAIRNQLVGDVNNGPQLIDGDILLDLIAGIVRSAHRADEADAMLEVLGALLDPFFMLENAWQAAASGMQHRLHAVISVSAGRDWHNRLPTSRVAGQPLLDHRTRPVPDPSSWSTYTGKSTRQWSFVWPCASSVQKAVSEIDIFASPYHIDSISHPGACAGETITIFGSNFGPTGRVYFPTPDATDPAFGLGGDDSGRLTGVPASLWTDTRIDVVVPPWATSGWLHLNAFHTLVDLCMRRDIYQLGNEAEFTGGLARVYKISINGVVYDTDAPIPNLKPNDTAVVSWFASNGPSTKVQVQLVSEFPSKVLGHPATSQVAFNLRVSQYPIPILQLLRT